MLFDGPENPLEFPGSYPPGHQPDWFITWSMQLDWSSILEKLFLKEVGKMPSWNSEDWMKNVWGPMIAAAVPEIIKAIPMLIAAIVAAINKMPDEQKAEVTGNALKLIVGSGKIGS